MPLSKVGHWPWPILRVSEICIAWFQEIHTNHWNGLRYLTDYLCFLCGSSITKLKIFQASWKNCLTPVSVKIPILNGTVTEDVLEWELLLSAVNRKPIELRFTYSDLSIMTKEVLWPASDTCLTSIIVFPQDLHSIKFTATDSHGIFLSEY